MKRLIAALLLLVSLPAFAESYAMRAGNLAIVLHKAACTETKVLSLIEEQYRTAFRKADVTHAGKSLKACWMALPDRQQVLVADETGDYGAVPMSMFKPVVGI